MVPFAGGDDDDENALASNETFPFFTLQPGRRSGHNKHDKRTKHSLQPIFSCATTPPADMNPPFVPSTPILLGVSCHQATSPRQTSTVRKACFIIEIDSAATGVALSGARGLDAGLMECSALSACLSVF